MAATLVAVTTPFTVGKTRITGRLHYRSTTRLQAICKIDSLHLAQRLEFKTPYEEFHALCDRVASLS